MLWRPGQPPTQLTGLVVHCNNPRVHYFEDTVVLKVTQATKQVLRSLQGHTQLCSENCALLRVEPRSVSWKKCTLNYMSEI